MASSLSSHSATQDADGSAIEGELTPPPAECWPLVDRVESSPSLCRSARLCEMLRYMCRRVLDESALEIHEEEIGTRLFGRVADYDKGADPIVRVQASHQRKRLAQYFESEGASEPIVLEVPKGSYLPIFRYRSRPASTRDVEPAPAIVPPPPPHTSETPLITPVLAVLCGLLAVTCAWLAFQVKRQSAALPDFPNQRSLSPLYARLFSPNARTSLIVADSSFTFLQDALQRRIPLDAYLSRDPDLWMKEARRTEKLDPRLDAALTMLAFRQYTSLADVSIASRIQLLLTGILWINGGGVPPGQKRRYKRPMIDLYIREQPVPDPVRAVAECYRLRRRFNTRLLFVSFRSDNWFIEDASFPVILPFVADRHIGDLKAVRSAPEIGCVPLDTNAFRCIPVEAR